jgi:hypothetical protein
VVVADLVRAGRWIMITAGDMRPVFAAALCAAACACSGGNPGHAISAYSAGWSAVHADASNSDYSPVRGARNLAFAWSRSFYTNINLGPTSDPGGRLYIAVDALTGCALYALDSATGETVWCSDEVDRFASISSPLIDGEGRLYIADGVAMHAFDRDGSVLWETPIIGVPLSAQFTPQGRVIFITHVGYIHVLDRATGANVTEPLAMDPGATWVSATGVGACATGRGGGRAARNTGDRGRANHARALVGERQPSGGQRLQPRHLRGRLPRLRHRQRRRLARARYRDGSGDLELRHRLCSRRQSVHFSPGTDHAGWRPDGAGDGGDRPRRPCRARLAAR